VETETLGSSEANQVFYDFIYRAGLFADGRIIVAGKLFQPLAALIY